MFLSAILCSRYASSSYTLVGYTMSGIPLEKTSDTSNRHLSTDLWQRFSMQRSFFFWECTWVDYMLSADADPAELKCTTIFVPGFCVHVEMESWVKAEITLEREQWESTRPLLFLSPSAPCGAVQCNIDQTCSGDGDCNKCRVADVPASIPNSDYWCQSRSCFDSGIEIPLPILPIRYEKQFHLQKT